jgi:hypothetical protein
VPGDHLAGRTIYDAMLEDPLEPTHAVVRGCYQRRSYRDENARYLDVLCGPGTPDQSWLMSLGAFLPLFVMLVQRNDWATRPTDKDLAAFVFHEARRRRDDGASKLAIAYLSCLMLEEDDEKLGY